MELELQKYRVDVLKSRSMATAADLEENIRQGTSHYRVETGFLERDEPEEIDPSKIDPWAFGGIDPHSFHDRKRPWVDPGIAGQDWLQIGSLSPRRFETKFFLDSGVVDTRKFGVRHGERIMYEEKKQRSASAPPNRDLSPERASPRNQLGGSGRLADALREKETLVYADLVEILGERPFGLPGQYSKFVTASGSSFTAGFGSEAPGASPMPAGEPALTATAAKPGRGDEF